MEQELRFRVGDWVIWTFDGDIGIVTDVSVGVNDSEPFFIDWKIEPGASGWHKDCNMLELLGGDDGRVL
jgi:hypothetical protein